MAETLIQPKIRGFICITAHPTGCAAHVNEQIDYIKAQPPLPLAPKKVLVIGASTGYGLSSRIAATFAGGADTLGVFFERPASNGRTASAGWYNTAAFEKAARAAGHYATSINGDAFSDRVKAATIERLKADMGPVDLVVYSLASPRRVDPKTGEVYQSTLKPIGQSFSNKTVNTDKQLIQTIDLEPASPEEIQATEKVMGGEDWALWVDALEQANLLAPGATVVAYSYIGPEVTWPIYHQGTIGQAKAHLETTAIALNEKLKAHGGKALVVINKVVVTQASSAIPVVPLYTSLVFKVMKEKGLHEGCIEQMHRLFHDQLFSGQPLTLDAKGRVRVDNWEMRPDVQGAVAALWPQVETENLLSLSDFKGYQQDFLKLFGFGLPGIDYTQAVEADVTLEGLLNLAES